ncbi:Glycosylphosphatidylinositol anchor attachment 1 protein [Clonorchis sinensis]|uniref:Glycosylphosphatidylinositol anchor attachment 1 protein n=1 Tax=Clonorchis sinensis TaxID=79923 RepID=A0A8T1MMC2_CLOSI|nr:Glycosylphosphatidylinositol anchor attachment 1 protein [Clonorchis sinensis]
MRTPGLNSPMFDDISRNDPTTQGDEVTQCLEREFTDRKVRRSNPTSVSRPLLFRLDNMAVSQPSCFFRVAWQLGTERPFSYGRGQTDVRRGDVFGLLNAVWTQASGSPTGLHGLLINYQIPAVTLRGPSCKHRSLSSSRKSPRLGKFVEGILRSLNNLQERLHQSFWYYLLPNPMRYISIGVYIPPVLILIGSLLIKTVGFWCVSVRTSETKIVSDDSLNTTATTLRTALSPDADQHVRKRSKLPSKPSSPATEKTSSPSKVEIRKDEDGIPPTLARLAIWTVTSFAFGLFLHVSPKVIFLLYEHPKWDGIQHFWGIQPLVGDFLAFTVLCLFGVVAFATPLIITIIYRFCVTRECQTERPWASSVLLITWTLLLTCMACLNVSASLLLSAFVVPLLLIFVRYPNHSKRLSCLFGLCWILLSPPVLLLLVCYIHLSFFEKGMPIRASAVDLPALQDFVTRLLVQLIIESDLFGSWVWPLLTCGYSSLWLLSWSSILCE